MALGRVLGKNENDHSCQSSFAAVLLHFNSSISPFISFLLESLLKYVYFYLRDPSWLGIY